MAASEVKSEVTGSLWKLIKAPGDRVEEDEPIMVLESMKMEIPVVATRSGRIAQILVEEGQPISEGQLVAVIET